MENTPLTKSGLCRRLVVHAKWYYEFVTSLISSWLNYTLVWISWGRVEYAVGTRCLIHGTTSSWLTHKFVTHYVLVRNTLLTKSGLCRRHAVPDKWYHHLLRIYTSVTAHVRLCISTYRPTHPHISSSVSAARCRGHRLTPRSFIIWSIHSFTTYLYIRVLLHIYTFVTAHSYVRSVCIYVYTYQHTNESLCTCTHINTRKRVCVRVQISTHKWESVPAILCRGHYRVNTLIYIYIYIYLHTFII